MTQLDRGGEPRIEKMLLGVKQDVWKRAQRWLDELKVKVPSLFPVKEVLGVDGLAAEVAEQLRGVSAIRLGVLPNEAKVSLRDGALTVHPELPLRLAVEDRQRARRQVFLYVAHEVAHIVQGIDNKAEVVRLHATEGEDTLLMLDLEADHAAAVCVAAIEGQSVAELKRDALAMLEGFRAGPEHAPHAVLRKARRAVALAADLEARRRERLKDNAGFAYVHWQRGGGAASVFVRQSYTRRLAGTRLNPSQAATLDAAAYEGMTTRRVLKVVKVLFDEAKQASKEGRRGAG